MVQRLLYLIYKCVSTHHQVLALDADAADNKAVRYEIEQLSENYFRVSKRTGEITVKRLLANHPNHEFSFTVYANDLGM